MKLSTIIQLIGEFIDALLGRINRKRGSVKAFRSYDRKARRDFQKVNGIHIGKAQRITEVDLLDIKCCRTADDVIKVLEKHDYHDGYVLRFAHIWEYYEHINTEQ